MSEKIDNIIDDAQTYLSLSGIDITENKDVLYDIIQKQDLCWTKYILPDGKQFYGNDKDISYDCPEYVDKNLISIESIT